MTHIISTITPRYSIFIYLFICLFIRKSKQLGQGQALTGIDVEYSIKINFARSPVHTKDKQTWHYEVPHIFKNSCPGIC